MKKIIGILTLLIILSQLVFAGVGTSAAQFLKINACARSSSLGGVRAISEGAESLFLNPSGLSTINKSELSFSQVMWIEDIAFSNIGFGHKTSHGTFGIGAQYLTVPSITKYDNTGTELADSYAPMDMAISLGYASEIFGILIGGNIKYISSKLDTQTATAYAIDFGLQKVYPSHNRSFGLAVHNLGTEMKYYKVGDPLPLDVVFGGKQSFVLGYNRVEEHSVSIYLDVGYFNDSGTVFMGGSEYLRKIGEVTVAGRVGYRTDIKGLDGIAGFACGLGANYKRWDIDYALAPYGELGLTHRISLGYKF